MNELKQEIWTCRSSWKSKPVWDFPVMDVEQLTNYVAAQLKGIYRNLGPGLPLCVYQLKLNNGLIKKGIQLRSENSLLSYCAENEPDRSLTIVNEMLVIEYISADNVTEHNKKRIKFDLQNNNHVTGLLINLSEGRENIYVSKVQRDCISH